MDETTSQRYRQASEWLVYLKSTSPSESEIERWLIWCEEDVRNLVAFEELDRDWNDLEGLRAMPELIPAADDRTLQWQASAGYQIDYSEREKTGVVASIDATQTKRILANDRRH